MDSNYLYFWQISSYPDPSGMDWQSRCVLASCIFDTELIALMPILAPMINTMAARIILISLPPVRCDVDH